MVVLYLDDEVDLLEVFIDFMAMYFPKDTYLVYTSAIEALDFLKKTPNFFDLIVSDQTMPEMTGTTFMRRAVEQGFNGNLIIFSSNCDDNVSFNLLEVELASKNPLLSALMIEKPNLDLLKMAIQRFFEGEL